MDPRLRGDDRGGIGSRKLGKLRRAVPMGAVAALVLGPQARHSRSTRSGSARRGAYLFAFSAAEVGIEGEDLREEEFEIEVTSFAATRSCSRRSPPAASTWAGLAGLGFRAKGAPAIGVAAMYGLPANLALVLPFDTPVKSVRGLKGKRIGVTTAGSPSRTGWRANFAPAGLGQRRHPDPKCSVQMQARLAAIQRGEPTAWRSRPRAATSWRRRAKPGISRSSAISPRTSTPT